ncbi:MAG TPA: MEDS domain-containing protein [Pseudomonadales bacterium]
MPRDNPISLQFYEEVAPLLNELARAMCIALDQKHAVLCAVSEGTRLLLEEQAAKRGIDVAAARERGQCVFLDGVDLLSEITLRGMPDPVRFHEVIGGHVKRLVRDYAGVWMYGELAAIMWGQGVERGAIELDRLWASLAESEPVVLCAAFPVEALSWPIVVKALQQEVAEQVRKLAKGSAIALAIHHGPTGS